jgi:hypothetical protein
LRCSVELLSKCSSSRMSVLLKYAVPVCRLEHLLPNAHRHLEEAVDDGDARHAVAPSSKLVWARRPRHRCRARASSWRQSRRLWFSQQVRLAIFCLGVSAGGDYLDNAWRDARLTNWKRRHRRLLRPCRQRPCGRRTAEQRDKFAPPHVGHGSSSRPGVTTSGRLAAGRACHGADSRSLGQT